MFPAYSLEQSTYSRACIELDWPFVRIDEPEQKMDVPMTTK